MKCALDDDELICDGETLSINDPIGAEQKRRRDRQAEGLGGLPIHDQLELGRLLDGKLGGVRAFQDLVSHLLGGNSQ